MRTPLTPAPAKDPVSGKAFGFATIRARVTGQPCLNGSTPFHARLIHMHGIILQYTACFSVKRGLVHGRPVR